MSAIEIANFYQGFVDGLVIDKADAKLSDAIAETGITPLVTATVMRDATRSPATCPGRRSLRRSDEAACEAERQRMNPWLVIPVKSLRDGKTRLASALDPVQRREFMDRLLVRTLDQAAQFPGLERTLVVSACSETRTRATALGAHVLNESGRGLNAALKLAHENLQQRSTTQMLVVPLRSTFAWQRGPAVLVTAGNVRSYRHCARPPQARQPTDCASTLRSTSASNSAPIAMRVTNTIRDDCNATTPPRSVLAWHSTLIRRMIWPKCTSEMATSQSLKRFLRVRGQMHCGTNALRDNCI